MFTWYIHLPYNIADETNVLRYFGGSVPNSRCLLNYRQLLLQVTSKFLQKLNMCTSKLIAKNFRNVTVIR
jgi:hypothetical protein